MRLGLRPTVFDKGTEKCKIRRLYGGEDPIWERHRHRYEVNPEYVERLEAPGKFRFIGKDERGERMQVLEMEGESTRTFLAHAQQLIASNRNQTTHSLSVCKLTQNSRPVH